jgi:hypothetical protein
MTNAVNIAQSGSNNQTMRNRIINGAMTIDQRNAGASVTASTTAAFVYTLDRWAYAASQASKFTVQQDAGAVTPPAGFSDYLGVTSSSAYSVTSSDYFLLQQPIEGFNVSDLGFGAADASTITVSFWVRSSLTGTFGGALQNSAQNRSYPFSYTISAANTWEQKSVTIAGDTTGTWLKTNGAGMTLVFSLGMGSSNSGTAGSWQASGVQSATGATSVVGTSGATFYITGVQLEEGTAASPFENRLYGTELSLCYRYYFRNQSGTLYGRYGMGVATSSTNMKLNIVLPVTMRSAGSSIDYGGVMGAYNGGSVSSVTSMTTDTLSPYIATLNAVVASGLTTNSTYEVFNNNNTAGYIGINAEL